LICVDSNGKEVWRKGMVKDLKGQVNPIQFGEPEKEKFAWVYSWSPLVDGDHVICFPGGSEGGLAALDRKTGNVVWRSKKFTEMASYSSPVVAELGGVRQYVVLSNKGLTGIAAKNGDVLWNWERKTPYGDVVMPT